MPGIKRQSRRNYRPRKKTLISTTRCICAWEVKLNDHSESLVGLTVHEELETLGAPDIEQALRAAVVDNDPKFAKAIAQAADLCAAVRRHVRAEGVCKS
jgi:hypothetical protein